MLYYLKLFQASSLKFLSSAWKAIKTVATKVTSVVESVAMLITTGSLDESISPTLTLINYNYDAGKASAITSFNLEDVIAKAEHVSSLPVDVAIVCTSCYVYSAVSIVISVSISKYQLKTAQVYVEGTQNFDMEFGGTLAEVEWDKQVCFRFFW